jgi:pilus assembly protein Flp/PilA
VAILRFVQAESGAMAIEYGLIAALIVLGVLAGMTATGASVGQLYAAALALIAAALAA